MDNMLLTKILQIACLVLVVGLVVALSAYGALKIKELSVWQADANIQHAWEFRLWQLEGAVRELHKQDLTIQQYINQRIMPRLKEEPKEEPQIDADDADKKDESGGRQGVDDGKDAT